MLRGTVRQPSSSSRTSPGLERGGIPPGPGFGARELWTTVKWDRTNILGRYAMTNSSLPGWVWTWGIPRQVIVNLGMMINQHGSVPGDPPGQRQNLPGWGAKREGPDLSSEGVTPYTAAQQITYAPIRAACYLQGDSFIVNHRSYGWTWSSHTCCMLKVTRQLQLAINYLAPSHRARPLLEKALWAVG